MNYRGLRKNLHQPVKLLALGSNATLPYSDWIPQDVSRASQRVLVENPATGYRLPLGPDQLHHYEKVDGIGWLVLKIGLYFSCPNAFFVDPDGRTLHPVQH